MLGAPPGGPRAPEASPPAAHEFQKLHLTAAHELQKLHLMLAVKQHGFGGREQLSLCELPRPTPKEGFVLVRVAAVSIHAGDHHMLTGRPYLTRLIGLNEIPGMDFSGVVEEVGPGLARFAAGDEVFGTTDTTGGAFAEYVSVAAKNIVRKPATVSWEEAACLPTSGMTALQALRLG